MNSSDGPGHMHTRSHALDSVANEVQQSESGSAADQGVQLTANNLPKDLDDNRVNNIRAALVIHRRIVDMHLRDSKRD